MTAVAAEVAPAQSLIVWAPHVQCLKPIRDVKLYIGPDPATDDKGQLRGPSTSDSKIEGVTLKWDDSAEPLEMMGGSDASWSVLNTSVPNMSSYSCLDKEVPSS